MHSHRSLQDAGAAAALLPKERRVFSVVIPDMRGPGCRLLRPRLEKSAADGLRGAIAANVTPRAFAALGTDLIHALTLRQACAQITPEIVHLVERQAPRVDSHCMRSLLSLHLCCVGGWRNTGQSAHAVFDVIGALQVLVAEKRQHRDHFSPVVASDMSRSPASLVTARRPATGADGAAVTSGPVHADLRLARPFRSLFFPTENILHVPPRCGHPSGDSCPSKCSIKRT